MRGLSPTRLAALGVALLSLSAAACGGGEQARPLPAAAADSIVKNLDGLEQRVAAGECADAKNGNLLRIRRQVERLPDDVDPDVRTTLEDGVDRLEQLIDEQCKQKEEPPPVEPTPTVPEETVPEETVPEETVPEPTQPEPTQPEPKQPKPKEEEEGAGGGGTGPGATGGQQPKAAVG